MDILIQKVVEEVIRRIKNQPKKAVVLFTGALIGFRESMDAIVKLHQDGWQLKVVLSDYGLMILDPEAIKKELNLDVIYHSGNIESQKDLVECADMFIIGGMSINTAAKLAVGITDTDLLTIINHGLMAGTPIVAAQNGCDPDDPGRAEVGTGKSPEKYRQMLIGNMNTLREFGVQLVPAEDLYETCSGKVPNKREVPKALETTVVTSKETVMNPGALIINGECILNKKVISRTDILKIKGAKAVKIPGDAIVTEYALEAIDSFGIQIIRI
ncbi:MAG: flavoprotein [Acetobacterium sp.]